MVPSSTEGLAQKKQWWGTALPPLPAPSPLQRRGSEGRQDFGLGQKYPFVVRLHAFGFFPWPDMLTMPQPPHRSPHWGGHLRVQCPPNKRRTHQDEQGLGSGLALPAWVRAAQGPCCTVQGSLTPSGEAAGCGTLSFAQSNARCQTAAGYCVGPPAGGLGEQNLGPRPSLPRLASEQCVPRVIRGKQSSVGTGPCFQIMPRASVQLCLQLCLGLVKVGRLVCG